jgi:hypothetical protein
VPHQLAKKSFLNDSLNFVIGEEKNSGNSNKIQNCVSQGIMSPPIAKVKCPHERGQDLHESEAVAEVSGDGVGGGGKDFFEGWGG